MIFVDASFLVGLLLTNDVNNPRANELIDLIDDDDLIINNTVLTETINFLSKCDIHYLTANDYSSAIGTYLHYDGAVNFSDCTILKSMESLGIDEIVSFDSDFDLISGIKRRY